MKFTSIRFSLAMGAMVVLAATNAFPQTQHQHGENKPASQTAKQQYQKHDMAKMDMSSMMNEPHHLLAMAYGRNIGTFAKALQDHATASNTLNVEFVRTAVAEMKRSLDQLEKHHKEHMQTMSEDMRSKMSAMMTEMEMHRSKLKDAVAVLERDVKADTPDAKRLAADSAEVLKHLDEMSKVHGDKGHKM